MGTRNVIRTSVPLPYPLSYFTLVARLPFFLLPSFLSDHAHLGLGEVLSTGIPVSHFTHGTTHRPTLENAISSSLRARRILDFEAGRASLLVLSAVCPSISRSYVFFTEKPTSRSNIRLLTVDFGERRDGAKKKSEGGSRWRWYICIYESAGKVICKWVLDIVSLQRYVSPNNRNTYAANSFGTSNPIVLDKTRPGYGFFEMVTAVFGGEWCERCIVVSRE